MVFVLCVTVGREATKQTRDNENYIDITVKDSGMRFKIHCKLNTLYLLPPRSEERGVLGMGTISVAILPSCQDMKTIAV